MTVTDDVMKMAWQTKREISHAHMTPYDMVKEVVINNARQYNEGLFFALDVFGDVQDVIFACNRTAKCVSSDFDITVLSCDKYKYLRVLGLSPTEQRDLMDVYDRSINIWE